MLQNISDWICLTNMFAVLSFEYSQVEISFIANTQLSALAR